MYLGVIGKKISSKKLSIPKAQDMAKALDKLPYVNLVECKKISGNFIAETVVFETEVELGQIRKFDIKPIERIAVEFRSSDKTKPEILALRSDFPRVSHLNLRKEEFPRSLCIFEENYDELKLQWRASEVIERIRSWLARSAKGILHGEDQPLEPLLLRSSTPLIMPYDLFTKTKNKAYENLVGRIVEDAKGEFTLIAERESDGLPSDSKGKFIACLFRGSPQPHGIIYSQPRNLFELHEFLKKADIDLLNELRNTFLEWNRSDDKRSILEKMLVMIFELPKSRNQNSAPESSDRFAFYCGINKIKEIGEEIGIFTKHDNYVVSLMEKDEKKQGNNIIIDLLNPMYSLTRDYAKYISGISIENEMKSVIVGVGAIGSQVLMNLVSRP